MSLRSGTLWEVSVLCCRPSSQAAAGQVLWADATLTVLSRDGPPSRAPIVLGSFFV